MNKRNSKVDTKPDNYHHEQITPSIPTCSIASGSLKFDGVSLKWFGQKQLRSYAAVSGKKTDAGGFDYSVKRQRIPFKGPIPEGRYWVQPSQLQKNAWYRLKNPTSAWGDYWLTIRIYPGTTTYNRGGFFIHGGSNAGSAGCIDLTSNMNQFVTDLKQEFKGLPECYIELLVDYSRTQP